MSALPIQAVLRELLTALRDGNRALLIAPPGAGKTTGVPPALICEAWCSGQVLLLVPRRLAARAAAEFMAGEAGEQPGATFGYQTRLDSKVGKATRVIAMTHGVFLSRLQADPELAGISAVLFDEVHERSLDNDLALALTLDAATALRPDLRLLAMSATPDADRLLRVLGDATAVVSEGKSFPLELQHVGRDAVARLEAQVARAARNALADHDGSLLAFLPGVAEIERTADALTGLPEDVVVHRLHGGIDPREQRAALAPPPPGKRKLVLATAIAETSVTVSDVRIVVDSGLARRPRYDRGAALTRLTTERASRAAVTQRAGRAARQAPGVAVRLWEEAATAALPAHDPPEILEADMSSLLLTCLMWGVADPARLAWLDPPPAPALAEARARLAALGALEDGRVTEHGRAIAGLPLEPRLAHMLIEASARRFGSVAAQAAALLGERGLGGNDPDLEVRLRRWRTDRSPRAEGARKLAARWHNQVRSCRSELEERSGGASGEVDARSPRSAPDEGSLALAIALAFPDRVCRRRDATGESWQSVGGRGFRLDPTSPLARSEWLAVAEVAGHAAGARILSAAPIDATAVLELLSGKVEDTRETRFDPAGGAVLATRSRKLGAIQLQSAADPDPRPGAILSALLNGVRQHGLALLPWDAAAMSLRDRTVFASAFDPAIVPFVDAYLFAHLDEWLAPLLDGKRKLRDIAPRSLRSALETLLPYPAQRSLVELAPAEFVSPAGSHHPIDYGADGGPAVQVRAQALFGLAEHPMLAKGRVPLTLAITSPAGRPIQTSRDLPSFWSGSWREVAKEMRGRYPKHAWPDDPASAVPTLRTKRASGR
jgi:ATP-dependent helicase HrpB